MSNPFVSAEQNFSTRDIKLAAALATLGFTFKEGAPASHTIVSKTEECVFEWWFQPGHEQHGQACAVEHCWKQGSAWTKANPDDPLTHMRAVLDARDLVISVIHGEQRLANKA